MGRGIPVRTFEEFRLPALAFEREASDRYREFEAWFVEHGWAGLGALCARLAGLHGDDYRRVADAGGAIAPAAVESARPCWIGRQSSDRDADEFFYRVATARQLIEIALAEEANAASTFESAAHQLADAPAQDLAASLGASSRRCAVELTDAIQSASPPDWEEMIAGGGGPCLALGAERRLRRT